MTAFSWTEAIFGREQTAQTKTGLTIGHPVKGPREPLLIADERLCDHIAISGRPGMDIPRLLEQLLRQQTAQGRGWIFIDTFGDRDMLERVALYAKKQGRSDEFYVLDLDCAERSNSYSLLHAGNPGERAARLLRALPPAPANPGADFYRQQANHLLSTIFEAVDAAGKSIGLKDLRTLLWHLDESTVDAQLLEGVPEGIERSTLVAMLDSLRNADGAVSAERLRQVAGGLAGRLSLLCQTLNAEYLLDDPAPELEFSDILMHNKMCYVKLPVMGQDSLLQARARMVLHDITTAFEARARVPRRLRTPFLCLMDCFEVYGLRMVRWERARSMRVCLAPVIRTEWERLASNDKDGFFDIIGNTFTKVWFGQARSALADDALKKSMAAALETLSAGECILNIGESAVHTRLAPYHLFEGESPEQGSGFIARRMLRAAARPRLAITVPDKAEVSP